MAVHFSIPSKKENDNRMKRLLSSGVMIVTGILSLAGATLNADESITKLRKKLDLREVILRKFFRDNHCPDEQYAGMFIVEADNHKLDWRLLPSLSRVESGGGRHAAGNNHFGWANGAARFASIGEAIHTVAEALSHGKYYKGKDLNGKLAAYNPRIDYKAMVVSIMNQIAPAPKIEFAD
jgi:hypothetical protein